MRKYMLAAVAAAALSTPAVARDGAWYAGIEGGLMKVNRLDFDYSDPAVTLNDGVSVKHKTGYDADLIGGYDFGMFRLEAESSYKRAGIDSARFDQTYFGVGNVDAGGHAGALSALVNGLVDFGNTGIGGYVGGGFGLTRVKYNLNVPAVGNFSDRDGAMAWQLIAGVRTAVTDNLDVGLKYRYFRTGKLRFASPGVGVDGLPFDVNGHWTSHSLLLSLVYNAGTVAPPPPPPPATQTCPDGSVIDATATCPPPPPPPPPPPVQRGERG